MSCQFVHSERTWCLFSSHGLKPKVITVLGSIAIRNTCQCHERQRIWSNHVHHCTEEVGFSKFSITTVPYGVIDGCWNQHETIDEGCCKDRSHMLERQFDRKFKCTTLAFRMIYHKENVDSHEEWNYIGWNIHNYLRTWLAQMQYMMRMGARTIKLVWLDWVRNIIPRNKCYWALEQEAGLTVLPSRA